MCSLHIDGLCCRLDVFDLTVTCSLDIDGLCYRQSINDLTAICSLYILMGCAVD